MARPDSLTAPPRRRPRPGAFGPRVARAACALVVATCAALLALLSGCGVEYPNCNGDNDCRRDGRHELCVNGRCQQCRTSGDCGPNMTCLRNRCVPGLNACDGDNDCVAGQHCVNHRCQARTECDPNRPCPSGVPCVAGRCQTAEGPEPPDPEDNRGRLCRFEPVYFSFDNSQLDEPSRRSLQTAADCLRREGNSRYVLIGRADPRGTTEYNLALGERRARTAQSYLISLGVDAARVAVSSEGSEAASGTDEASWARDRRVDFRPRD
jgi:peptidoglycan-associated lipoprotein